MDKEISGSLLVAVNRIYLAVVGGLILLSGYFIAFSYFNEKAVAKKATLFKLQAAVNEAVSYIDPEIHQQLQQQFRSKNAIRSTEQNELYQQLHDQLDEVAIDNQLNSPIYTLVYNKEKDLFEFIVTSAETPYFRHTFTNYPKELMNVPLSGAMVDVYEDENGKWLSAAKPIINAKGEQIGIIQADESYAVFLAELRRELFFNLIISLAVIVPIAIALRRFIQYRLNREHKIRGMLIQQNNEIREQKEELEQQSQWISDYNNRLEKARFTIEKKNKELSAINEDLDRKVKQRTAELEKSTEELSQFLYRSSHDILGPLASIQGLYNLAYKDLKDSKGKIYIEKIGDSALKLREIIKGINLVYELKIRSVRKESIHVNELINSILASLEQSITFHQIQVEKNYSEHQAYTDPYFLRIVLEECIKNAIQYRTLHEVPVIKICILKKGYDLEIRITDNGQGIQKGQESNIFGMFRKANEQATGTGLGLYLAELCTKELQGSIKVEPEEKGTTVVVKIPQEVNPDTPIFA